MYLPTWYVPAIKQRKVNTDHLNSVTNPNKVLLILRSIVKFFIHFYKLFHTNHPVYILWCYRYISTDSVTITINILLSLSYIPFWQCTFISYFRGALTVANEAVSKIKDIGYILLHEAGVIQEPETEEMCVFHYIAPLVRLCPPNICITY